MLFIYITRQSRTKTVILIFLVENSVKSPNLLRLTFLLILKMGSRVTMCAATGSPAALLILDVLINEKGTLAIALCKLELLKFTYTHIMSKPTLQQLTYGYGSKKRSPKTLRNVHEVLNCKMQGYNNENCILY